MLLHQPCELEPPCRLSAAAATLATAAAGLLRAFRINEPKMRSYFPASRLQNDCKIARLNAPAPAESRAVSASKNLIGNQSGARAFAFIMPK